MPGSHVRDADFTGQARTRHQYFCKVLIDWNVRPVPRSVQYGLIHHFQAAGGNGRDAFPRSLGLSLRFPNKESRD